MVVWARSVRRATRLCTRAAQGRARGKVNYDGGAWNAELGESTGSVARAGLGRTTLNWRDLPGGLRSISVTLRVTGRKGIFSTKRCPPPQKRDDDGRKRN